MISIFHKYVPLTHVNTISLTFIFFDFVPLFLLAFTSSLSSLKAPLTIFQEFLIT